MPRSRRSFGALLAALGAGAMMSGCSDQGQASKAADHAPALAEAPPIQENAQPAGATDDSAFPGAAAGVPVGERDGAAPSAETSAPAPETETPASTPASAALVFPWSDARSGEWASYRLDGGAVQQWVVLEAGTRKVLLQVQSQYPAGAGGRHGPVFERTVMAEDDPFPHLARAGVEEGVAETTVTLPDGRALECVLVVDGETVTWWSPDAPCDGVVRRVQGGVLVRELVNFTKPVSGPLPPSGPENGQ